MPSLTGHMLIQNEDRFIWFAISSVLPSLDQLLITDNGSTDTTLQIIKSFKSPKIKLTQLPPTDRAGLVDRRRQQLKQTKTDLFFLIDGDEIWPESSLKSYLNAATTSLKSLAFVCRTRNCVGDILHYQPESAGRYQLLGRTGHFTIRLIRNHPQIKLTGEYPLEAYTFNQTPLTQLLEPQLHFVDTWYLHTTHLSRSTSHQASLNVIDRLKKFKLEVGRALLPSDLPEAFFTQRPSFVPDPFALKYSFTDQLAAYALTPLRILKRQLAS